MSDGVRRTPLRTSRAPVAGAAAVLACALVAGCFGGRGTTGAPAPNATDTAAVAPTDREDAVGDSAAAAAAAAARDSAAADSARRDSAAADTITRRDSAATDSAAGDTLPGDRARRDTVPVAGRAPEARECVLDFTQSPPESRLVTTRLRDGSRTTFIGGGVVAQCQGDPQVISADSAEYFQAAQILIMRNNVRVEEPGVFVLTAPTLTYLQREEKLVADGGVVVTDVPTGSTLSGPSLEYFRAIPGSRPTPRLFAPNRPVARLIERDSTGAERPPVTISAIYMEDRGDGQLAAWGQVEVLRDDVIGESDTASFDKERGTARLLRNATILSRDTVQPFRLAGDTIDLFTEDRVLERVVALHRATATQEALRLAAERIDLRLDQQRLKRAYAFGGERATAETPQQALEADSITVELPAQRVEELVAIGRAIATGTPDTMRIRSEERDVLRGDTVIARFDTLRQAGDTVARSVLREVQATGDASSLYQIPSQRGPTFPPSINYVTGWRITVAFDTGTVRTVAVDSQASGVYLEPVPDSTVWDSVARDSAARPDSSVRDSSVRPDSMVGQGIALGVRATRAGSPRSGREPPERPRAPAVPVRMARSSSIVLERGRPAPPLHGRPRRPSPLRFPPAS